MSTGAGVKYNNGESEQASPRKLITSPRKWEAKCCLIRPWRCKLHKHMQQNDVGTIIQQAHGWQLHILRSRGYLRRLIWPTVFLKHSARWQEAIFIVWFQARGNLGEREGDIHRGTCMCSAFSMKKAVVRDIQSCTARWNLPKNLKQKHYRSNPHQRTSFWSTVQTSLQISDSITSS